MILYLIPARGGSKRLPGKNLRKLAGIPLVAWAIRRAQGAARLVGGESRVVVSTDSEEIAAVSREWGAEVLMRPYYLASDEATATQVVQHALEQLGPYPRVAYIQPTSPLATPEDVAGVIPHTVRDSVAFTTVAGNTHPNGAAYVIDTSQGFERWLTRCENYRDMPGSRSIDIDTEDDWKMAEALLAARDVAPFEIAGRKIGPGRPCFVIAEAGINHGGDPQKAHALVDAAADAGADAVKFQTFLPSALAEPGPHWDMLNAHVLEFAELRKLKAHADERGLIFLSSVFDEESADIVDESGAPAFKIPSGEIINLPLLRHVASKGKPVILSTGMSTMREVAAAVDALSGVPLALLHCVSEYPPACVHTSNLRAMDTMRQAFGVPVGWSDHSAELEVTPEVAVAMGASILEKHLCLDGYDGPDAKVSYPPTLFRGLVNIIRSGEACRGDGEKVPTPGELETAKVARRRDGLRRNAS